MIVCVKCGRKSTRGFVILRGTGDGTNDQWICGAYRACDARAAAVALAEATT